MIYWRESPPGGMFNKFVNEQLLERIAVFVQERACTDAGKWELPSIPPEACKDAQIGFIRLDHTGHLYVSGDTLFFSSTFDCRFPQSPDDGFEDAPGAMLDVIGRILFHPPGTKRYDLRLSEIHPCYNYPRSDENYVPNFPGVRVSQMLHPAFGFNERQRHEVLEKEADRFLIQYWPSALESVSSVPLRQIAEDKMGTQVYTGYRLSERADSLGLTVFQTQKLTVADEETGAEMIRRFPRGSIIIDADTIWDRGLGSFNFTLAHEMYHWYAHRVYMAFMDIMGRPDDYRTIKGHLESQADGVGARILMPRRAVEQKYKELLDGSDTDAYEVAVAECAAFFGASKTAMRKRLGELGLYQENRSPSVRRRLDIVDMFGLYASDRTFRNLLDSGAYRYLKGYVVKNDPKYIADDALTDYAREHPSECVMTFREEYLRHDTDGDNLLFRKDTYFSLRADYDERMEREPEAMAQLAEKLKKMKDAFISGLDEPQTFSQFMMPIITKANTKIMGLDIRDEADDGFDEGKLVLQPDRRYRNRYFLKYDLQTGKNIRITEPEVFQDRTLIGYKTFEKLRRNDWNKPELDKALAACTGYHLDMETTEKALLCAGFVLMPHIMTHLVYRFLIMHCRDMYTDTGTFNTLLILLGETEIGTNKKKKE